MSRQKLDLTKHQRNGSLVDRWSVVHFVTSVVITLLVGPIYAFIITLLWEPIEILVLSPWLAKYGIMFGHEHLSNSLSDIFFNSLGIAFAVVVL